MRVAIVSPARDMCHTAFTHDLANMMAFTACNRPDIRMGNYLSLGTMIFDQRIKLAREAVADESDYLLWFDTDMRFPKDTLLRLLAHQRDIVAANYVTRQLPPEPVAFKLTDDGRLWRRVPTFPDERDKEGNVVKKGSTGLEKVSGAPMGVMMTHAKVFKKLDENKDVPMFWFQYSVKNHTVLGEDIYFCINAIRNGFDIWIDHDLSKEVKHVGMFEFGHEHVDEAGAAKLREDLDKAETVDLNKDAA